MAETLLFYDAKIDASRPATQLDIDMMTRRIGEFAMFWTELLQLVEASKQRRAAPHYSAWPLMTLTQESPDAPQRAPDTPR